jgi:putative NADPH-quinone reductase
MTREELGSDLSTDALVLQHQEELKACDQLVIMHPNWWGQPPAVLKGWLDRVLRNGVAYQFGVRADGSKGMIGMLPVQKLTVFTTSNTPNEQEKNQWGDPLDAIWTKYVAGFCCFPEVQRINFSPVIASTPEIRERWIQEACSMF